MFCALAATLDNPVSSALTQAPALIPDLDRARYFEERMARSASVQ